LGTEGRLARSEVVSAAREGSRSITGHCDNVSRVMRVIKKPGSFRAYAGKNNEGADDPRRTAGCRNLLAASRHHPEGREGGLGMADNDLESKKPSAEELQAEVERLRADKAALEAELARKQKPARGHFPWRGTIAWILIVLACLMAILAPIAVWAKTTFLNTDNFVQTVGPLITDETVAQPLSTEIADRLFIGLDIENRIKEALQEVIPDKLTFIAGPISSGLKSLTQKLTYEVLTSSQFQTVLDKILRVTHSTAVGIIEGDKAVSVSSGGEVTLDVGELVTNVKNRLVDAGLTFLEKVPIPEIDKTIVLFTSSQLGMAKQSVDLLNTLGWFLPILALVLFAAAVLISEDRRRYLMIASAALALAMALSLMVLDLAKGELLGQVKNPANLDAATFIWNTVSANLIKANVGLLTLGIVGALGFAIAGPYAWAVWLRRKSEYLFALLREHRLEGKESGPVGVFFAAHIWGLRVAGVAVLFGILWLVRPLSGVKVIVALGIYLVYLVICELLRGKLPQSTEAVVPGEEGAEGPPEENADLEGESSEKKEAAKEKTDTDDKPQEEDAGKEEDRD